MEPRISIVTLGVQVLERSRQFYKEAFGWEPASAQETISFYQLGGLVLALYPHNLLAADANAEPEQSGFRGITLAYNVREKTEVAQVMAIAEAAGATIVKPAADTDWGGHGGYLADPDGHLWEIAYNPFFPLNAKGEIEIPTA
ncbi:MAG: VOC family protein [Planctomycetaceae bacterium]|nr:VOC family protein [Planctomycetaceae bacterium]